MSKLHFSSADDAIMMSASGNKILFRFKYALINANRFMMVKSDSMIFKVSRNSSTNELFDCQEFEKLKD